MFQMLKHLAPALIFSTLLSEPAFGQTELSSNNQTYPVTVSLSSGAKSISPGQKFKVQILVQMKPNWHLYYKEPGQTGLPTQVVWNLPTGFIAGPLLWQPPETFIDSGIRSYAYKKITRICAEILAPSQLQRGRRCRIAATVKWLACKQACIPGDASVVLSLPIH